jgi:lipopolysaccharide/colanic/teichoic acid biosynthesis glycosyltransferase
MARARASTSAGVPPGSARYPGVGLGRRTLDVLVAGTGLAVLMPVLVVIALAVRVSSEGSVLFRQVRLKDGRREFTILKFRTMRVAQDGPEITAARDERITAVGAFLRRTHIDELPQLVNVLRGDMTLVGPRPETPRLAARYAPGCRWVLEHRPGLTGPTQVRSLELNNIPDDVVDTEQWYLQNLVPQRVGMDATYLDHPTLAATLRVLIDTARHVIASCSRHGAQNG